MSKAIGRVALVGAGAVGGYYGSLLSLTGVEVHFLFRSSYHIVKKEGLYLIHHSEGGRKELVDPLHAHANTRTIGECDWVIVASKTTANLELSRIISPLIGDHTKLLTLQNGMGNVENLARSFGNQRTILAGLCFTCINRTAPNIVESLLPGYVQFGQLGQSLNSESESIVQAFEFAGVSVKRAKSLDEVLWRKLCWNIPFNGLSIAAGGITTDLILARPELRDRAQALMLEVQAGAKNYGIEIEDSFLRRQFELTEPMGPYKPSSLIDFLAGKPIEVDAIWGEALRRGKRRGVNMKELEKLYGELGKFA